MAELAYQTPDHARYYRPPAAFRTGRLSAAMAGACLVLVGLAWAYVWGLAEVEEQMPRLAVVGGFTAAVSGAVAVASRVGRVTSPAVAAVVGILLSLFGLYASWVLWVHRVLDTYGADVSVWELLIHPVGFFRLIEWINGVGAWSYDSRVYTGGALLAVWVVEALILVVVPTGAAIATVRTTGMFCAACGRGLEPAKGRMPQLAGDREDEVKAAVEAYDFDALLSHDPLADEDDPQIDFSLDVCRACGQTRC